MLQFKVKLCEPLYFCRVKYCRSKILVDIAQGKPTTSLLGISQRYFSYHPPLAQSLMMKPHILSKQYAHPL
jgi:hypothetical protein